MLVFVTGNLNKVKQVEKYCHTSLQHKKIDLPEIQSLDTEEVIEHKVKEAYQQLHTPVLVEDVSLRFLALGKLPGTFIKWFLQELAEEGMCRLLDGYTDRSAIAQVTYGLYDGKEVHMFTATANGTIADTPRGNSWGWNQIFIPEGHTKTYGEMNEEELADVSMRKIALEKLELHLQKK